MFYLTTAIDYTNGAPHIGHAYEKVLADVITRYQKLAGNPAYFLTGVDQHGQKVQQSAAKEDVNPATFVTRLTKQFKNLWQQLEIEHDGWAETIDPRHKSCVQNILQDLFDRGQIYKKSHSGFYSVRQEQFLTDKERNADGQFGDEWGEVVELEEENYYFRLTEHASWLKTFVDQHPDYITPKFRRNELLQALDRAAESDLCISRPKSRLRWGIELPFDEEFVTYVWFDALLNYISFAGYRATPAANLPDFDQLWPAAIQIIGKDIMIPAHAIYWPIMLHAIGFNDSQIPRLLVHGWWNIKNAAGQAEKMSKSLGNVIDPVELANTFGTDAVRYYLVRDIHTGNDSDFDLSRLVMLYNTELANNLGNLCNRALNMSKRFLNSTLSPSDYDDEQCQALRAKLPLCVTNYRQAMEQFAIADALTAVIDYISAANGFAEMQKPWELAKDQEAQARLTTVLTHLTEVTTHATIMLSPILPSASHRLLQQLNAPQLAELKLDQLAWGVLPANHQLGKPKPAFPRIDLPADD